jgi:hypothetical protein
MISSASLAPDSEIAWAIHLMGGCRSGGAKTFELMEMRLARFEREFQIVLLSATYSRVVFSSEMDGMKLSITVSS